MPIQNDAKMPTETGESAKPLEKEKALSTEELDKVSGGFNPQPDPPARAKFNPVSEVSPGPCRVG